MSVILEAKHISKNFGLTQALNLKESLLWTENHINQQTHWMHRIMESV